MNERERLKLQSALRTQIADAGGRANTDIEKDRAHLFDRYMGKPYGDEQDGRSKVVMSDVADTIEWIKPELLDFFTKGDNAAELAPVDADDVQQAEIETRALNHVFYQQNDGFLIMAEWFTDALLMKNGYVRSDWDSRDVVKIDEYRDITQDELARIEAEAEESGAKLEIVLRGEDKIIEAAVMTPAGPMPVAVEGWDYIKTRTVAKNDRYLIETIPPDEMEVSPRWKSIFLREAPYCAHRGTRTVSWCVEKGFNRAQVEKIHEANDDDNETEISRWSQRGAFESTAPEEADKSAREIEVREAYMRFDINDDGKSELLRIWAAGSGDNIEILQWENGDYAVDEVEEPPFSPLTPIIVPHRHVGRSVAELVDDLQKIRTVLTRQMLDNVYQGNNARKVVYGLPGKHTISDLLNNRPGSVIRAPNMDPGSIQFEVPPNLVPSSLQALGFMDEVRENRTGVTKYNQGMDANSLNKTATGIQQILSASQKKILLIARIFAETGVKDLFRRIHKDLRNGPSNAIMLNFGDGFIETDPREWRERDDVTVNVGLGTGDKDTQLGRVMMLRQAQVEDARFGLVGIEERARLNEELVNLSGFKGKAFFKSPDQIQSDQQNQGPEEPSIEQQILMLEAQNAQADRQIEILKLQFKREEMLMKDDRERDKVSIENMTKIATAELDGDAKFDAELIRAENQPPQGMPQ